MPAPAIRAEALALYRPVRIGIRRVLRAAVEACGRPDLERARRHVAPWAATVEGEQAMDMLADVALFEPNRNGRRAYDRFLAGGAGRLGAADQALAGRMAAASFSLFRLDGRHPTAGLWLADMLAGDRRLWLMDEALEASAPDDLILGMRLFDAGPFHAGFGIVVVPDDDTAGTCLAAAARGDPLPFRHSLAATLYGDQLLADAAPDAVDSSALDLLLEVFATQVPAGKGARAGARSRKPPRRRGTGSKPPSTGGR